MLGKLVGTLVSILFLSILGSLGYMVGDRNFPIILLERSIVSVRVPQGGQLLIHVRFIVAKQCESHTDRFLFDREDIKYDLEPLEAIAGSAEIGRPEEYTIPVDIPIDFKAGKAIFRSITTFKCNVIQNMWPLYAPVVDTPFEVVEVDKAQVSAEIVKQLRELLSTP